MKTINLDGHNEYNIEEVDGDYWNAWIDTKLPK